MKPLGARDLTEDRGRRLRSESKVNHQLVQGQVVQFQEKLVLLEAVALEAQLSKHKVCNLFLNYFFLLASHFPFMHESEKEEAMTGETCQRSVQSRLCNGIDCTDHGSST